MTLLLLAIRPHPDGHYATREFSKGIPTSGRPETRPRPVINRIESDGGEQLIIYTRV